MSVDNCLILSAGFGTRMGVIGKSLPKPLWPLFETNLIYAQIEYAKSIGCRNIFINIHHQHSFMKDIISKVYDRGVTLILEKDILGSGGAIHNLMNKFNLKSNYLITINADAFLFTPNINKILSNHLPEDKVRATILTTNTHSDSGYSKLVIENNQLTGIKSAPTNKSSYLAYSGISIVNMQGLSYLPGFSNFFNSVVDYKNFPVNVIATENDEFWDFGTAHLYATNLYKIIDTIKKGKKSLMIDFLTKNNFILLNKVGKKSYNSPDIINFTKECHTLAADANTVIVMDSKRELEISQDGIYYNGIVEKL